MSMLLYSQNGEALLQYKDLLWIKILKPISIMKVVPKLDSGPIFMKSKVSISKDINSEILSKTLSDLGSTMIIKSLSLIENSDDFVEQNENDATYAKKINKSEAKINWQESAEKNIAK